MDDKRAVSDELARLHRMVHRTYALMGALLTLGWVAALVMDIPK